MKISDLADYVAPEVPGCNIIAIERAIIDAVRAFCAASWAWEYDTSAWIRAGRDTGVIRLLPSMSACALVSWASDATNVPPVLYQDGLLRVPADVVTDTRYTLVVAVQPKRTETEIPDWLDEKHREAITSHAAHALLMLPGKDWSNPGRAVTLYQIYLDSVNAVKRERNTNRLRGAMRVRVPGAR